MIQERKRNFVKPNIMKVLGAVYCYSNAEMLLVDLEVCQTQHQYRKQCYLTVCSLLMKRECTMFKPAASLCGPVSSRRQQDETTGVKRA